jgi:hypothetical protein
MKETLVNRKLSVWPFALVCLLATQVSVAGLTPYLGTDACSSQEQSAYNEGVAVGTAQGHQQGYTDGTANGIALCQQDPATYGITVDQVLQQGGYGETEPNEYMAEANALVADVPFLGQSKDDTDQDWFYVVTTKMNQILTLDFTVPSRDSTQAATGWTIQVTDSAGNVYASFPTGFDGKPETTYPVTLGLVGTWYVAVKPVVTLDSSGTPTVTSDYYSLAVVLTDSDMDSLPVAVNFFDTEVEPNNTPSEANPIATGVTMFGLINLDFNDVITATDSTTGGTAQYAQGEDDDWFVFDSAGSQIVTLSFCNKQTCESGGWFVEVYDQAGANQVVSGGRDNPLVAFNTDSGDGWPYTINFGLGAAGKYYLRVNLKRKLEAPCLQTAQEQQCNNTSGICIVPQCTDADGKSCTPSDSSDSSDSSCTCADVSIDNCGIGNETYKTTCWTQTTTCLQYGTVVVVPQQSDDTPVSQSYNFTWYATNMQPFTANTEVYEQYLQEQQQSTTPTGGQ